jgi:hypothetical protein
MTMDLYTLHATAIEGEFIIQKFDTDYVCQSVYAMTSTECQCPQGHKDRCRHRTMFPLFLKFGHIGDGWFLEWNTRQWRRPVHNIATEPVSRTAAPHPEGSSYALSTEALPATGSAEVAGHDSDCATHNEPAYPNGPCNCSLGAEAPLTLTTSPPSPPEGPQPPQAAEAAPASPVGVGAPIVKRRRIP